MNDRTRHDEPHGMMIGGLIVLGIGILFLLHNLEIIPGFEIIWPIFPIIVGIALILGALFRGKRSSSQP